MRDPNTTLLLEQWHSGDDDALERLLQIHMDWAYREARSRMSAAMRAKMDTMDLLQEAMREFLHDAPRFHIENGKAFRGLLRLIIERTHMQEERRWRAKRRDIARDHPIPPGTVLDLETPNPGPITTITEDERQGWIRLGLEFLTPAEREIIALSDYDKLPWTEIGTRLHKSEDAVRMQHKRAVNRLATIIGKLRRGQLEDLVDGDAA